MYQQMPRGQLFYGVKMVKVQEVVEEMEGTLGEVIER